MPQAADSCSSSLPWKCSTWYRTVFHPFFKHSTELYLSDRGHSSGNVHNFITKGFLWFAVLKWNHLTRKWFLLSSYIINLPNEKWCFPVFECVSLGPGGVLICDLGASTFSLSCGWLWLWIKKNIVDLVFSLWVHPKFLWSHSLRLLYDG